MKPWPLWWASPVSPARFTLLAVLISLLLITGQMLWGDTSRVEPDERDYSRIARNLMETGRFSTSEPAATGPVRSEMNIVPLYPGFVAAMGLLSDKLKPPIDCIAARRKACDRSGLALLFGIQTAAAVLGATAAAWSLLWLLGCQSWALVALTIFLATGVPAKFCLYVMSEAVAMPLFFCFLAAFLWGSSRKSFRLMLLAGLLLGACGLVRPSYVYLAYMLAPLVFIWMLFLERSWSPGRALLLAAALPLGALISESPWYLRNILLFDQLALTGSYGGLILAQRLAYNEMELTEWAVSFVYWLPDFGDSLSQQLFPAESYQRLNFDHENSFYQIGNNDFMTLALARSGGSQHLARHLIENHLLTDLPKHLVVTLSLAWRGLWAGKYLALTAIVLLPLALRVFFQGQRALKLIYFAIPFLLMLGFHAFVSVNIVRYNLPLVLIYSAIITGCIAWLARSFSIRWLKQEREN